MDTPKPELIRFLRIFSLFLALLALCEAQVIYDVELPRQGRNYGLFCPGRNGQFPYNADCSTYIQCDNGVPTLKRCQGGLEFNPIRRYCDWPGSVVNCQRRPRRSGIPRRPGGGAAQGVDYAICSAAPNGGDPVNGFQVPHPQICNAFYTCNRFYLYMPCTFCPKDMYFSPIERRCRRTGTGNTNAVCQGKEYVPHDQKTYRQQDGTCRAIPYRRGRYYPRVPSYVPGRYNVLPGVVGQTGGYYLGK